MNGLQPVSIRVCKRIRCLPTCPLGTRSTILSRRLARGPVQWYHIPSGPDSTSAADLAPTASIFRYIARPVLGSDETVRPNPRAAAPLDSEVTKLTPLSVELREAPIRRLLGAIDRREDIAMWRYFSFLTTNNMTPRLSVADYSSILLSLRPKRYVSLWARQYLNESGEARLISKGTGYEEFRRKLEAVSMGMRANGYSLNVLEYAHLLDCASAGRDTEMAQQLWNQMTAQEGITPDTWAYNSYMAAMCGTASTNREIRITARNLSQSAATKDNVRDIALTVYKHMIEHGVTPNAMTFDILMLAVARMGDLASVRRILKEAWGVDAATLGAPETPETMRPLMARDSPLYPSIHTLTSVAVAFSSNNDIETAIRIVDHLARRYKIPIPPSTWVALLNWTFVFTRPPALLPKYSVINLWRIMIAEPYRVKPTIEMYDYLVRSLIHRKMPPDAEEMINRALRVFSRLVIRTSSVAHTLSTTLSGFPRNRASYDTLSNLRRDLAAARREVSRGRSIIRRWIELLCLGKGMRPYHARIRVPNAVRKMRYFLSGNLHYVTPSGYVELKLGDRSKWRAMSVRRRKRAWTPLGTGAKETDYLD